MFIQIDHDVQKSPFPTISMEVVDCLAPQYSGMPGGRVIDYYVSEFPRRLDKVGSSGFDYVYTLFEDKLPAFSPNQNAIVEVSSHLFAGSASLTHFEEQVLASTLTRTAKKQATRPNRK